MKAFWIRSTNLTQLSSIKNARTDTLLTSSNVTSVTGQLYDLDDVAVGDPITFTPSAPGAWYAEWDAPVDESGESELTEGSTYKLEVVGIGPGNPVTNPLFTWRQTLPARYRGPEDD